MWREGNRRVVLHPQLTTALAKLLGEARQAHAEAMADLAVLNFEHQCTLSDLRAEITELRSIVSDVVTGLRQSADRDVAQLRKELERILMRLAPRDPTRPLQ
jgi:hypothetical protein